MGLPALKYLRNAVVDSPPVKLGDTILTGTTASVSFVVPLRYDMLLLSWDDVYGDQIADQLIELTLLSSGSGYDDSYIALGTASNADNNTAGITLGTFGDIDTGPADGEHYFSSGHVIIFNRNGYEKVVIGTEVHYSDDTGATAPEDVFGYHIEAKDRDTGVITAVTLTPSAGNFTQGRFTLLGIATKDGR